MNEILLKYCSNNRIACILNPAVGSIIHRFVFLIFISVRFQPAKVDARVV